MARIPDKLKKDSIFQAAFDVRFTCRDLAEVVVGRLAGQPQWKQWDVQRLPVADIPSAIRQQDPTLQFQPLLELRAKDSARLVRIGERSFSCHALLPYPGWTVWKPELSAAIDLLYGSFEDFAATRFGFRYVNTMTPDHFINDVADLRLAVRVADAPLGSPLMVNYQRNRDDDHIAVVRIASREFVSNPVPSTLSAVVDIDIYTPEKYVSRDEKQAAVWLESAHVQLKEEFFQLFTDEILEKLREDT
jgi:uncharacterized protein (TIGR04255 family)